MIGRVENARYRALEALLSDPKLADPDPARSANVPPDQASFLKAYQSREDEMINFLKQHNLITLPDYLGKFEIRQLPDALSNRSEPRRVHESARCLRQGFDRLLFHPDVRSAVEKLLYPRGDRRSASDPGSRRDSPGHFSPTVDRESSDGSTKFAASTEIMSSSKAGRFMAKRC